MPRARARQLAHDVPPTFCMAGFDASLSALETALTSIEGELPSIFSALPRAPTLPPLDSARLHRTLVASGLLLLTAFLRLSGTHTEKHAMLVEEMDRLKVLSMRLRTVAATARVEVGGGGGGGGDPHLSLDGGPARRVDAGAAGRFVRAALDAPDLAAPAAGKRPRE